MKQAFAFAWIIATLLFMLAFRIGYLQGLKDQPVVPCEEERRIAFNDGYTLGWSDQLDHAHRSNP